MFAISTEISLGFGILISVAAVAYLCMAVWCLARLPQSSPNISNGEKGLTVLKPLCGYEPELEDCLRSFFMQDYPGPLQIVLGARSLTDPAVAIARQVAATFPNVDASIVVDDQVHGSNLKISNLVNMMRIAKHDLFVISDSDVRIDRDCLRRVMSSFDDGSVGAVTCLYRAALPRHANWVSRLGALNIDAWFIPAAVVAATLFPVAECYGPLTIVRRDVIERAGGFEALRNVLADDYELGQITVRQGLRCIVAPIAVETTVPETSLRELLSHELRWARTARALTPKSFIASLITNALPITGALFGFWHTRIAGLFLGLVPSLRILAYVLAQHRLGGRGRPLVIPSLWQMIMRELLSFIIWAAAFAGNRITWRGRQFRIAPGARLIPAGGSHPERKPWQAPDGAQ
ncbi:bacteriohopanetetrol glucosamine biosynthesis glycosyltransferase HpnI [Microvirga sp. 2TAF3]|uniref:bacteriohopanetetrol glucosamine biosynthesis glycosyltransferase HpnI n=1 Tax=Microvirga sp. 2TAF3 TaxID=3233014 RepID=UPI003F99509C